MYLTTAALNRIDLDLDLNSAAAAKGAFKALRPEDFKRSAAVARYLEAVTEVVEEFDEPGLGSRYVALVRRFVARYNLPYTLCDEPFVLRPRLPCALDAAYRDLEKTAAADPHLGEALDAFGKAWAEFFEAERPSDLKSAIDKASKLAEAFVGKRLGKSDALGTMVDELRKAGAFPHGTIGAAVKNIYGFCSNYPHIRHAGNPNSVLRALEARDVTFVSLVLIAFAGYAAKPPDQAG